MNSLETINNAEHYRKLERMYLCAPINKIFQPKVHISAGQAEIITPMQTKLHHAANAAHGSVYFKSLDDAAFFACNSLLRDYFVLTASFNLYLIRPIASGEMIAKAKVVQRSKRLFLAEAEVFNSEGKLIAKGSGSFMPSRIKLSAEIGYL